MNKLLDLKVGEDGDVAYLKFTQSDGKKISQQIHVNHLLANFSGPDIYLDITVDGEIAGIEILL